MNKCTRKNSLMHWGACEYEHRLYPVNCWKENWPSGESHKGKTHKGQAARHISTAVCLPTVRRFRQELLLPKNPQTHLQIHLCVSVLSRRTDNKSRLLTAVLTGADVAWLSTINAQRRWKLLPVLSHRQPETVIKPRRLNCVVAKTPA